MLRTNEDSLVKLADQDDIKHPGKVQDFIVDGEGMANVLPSTGGICYNYQVGDNCMNLAGDHVEPGVTTYNQSSDFARNAYNLYSCIGNEARVVTGNAKGAKG